ncbi:MAG: hypothetical protein OEZ01_04735, partial [Candidatus Heimdallarchaeota archaeon]|nr:hypothetical protein [Candidatus Heimdallarchaeota archaeon]
MGVRDNKLFAINNTAVLAGLLLFAASCGLLYQLKLDLNNSVQLLAIHMIWLLLLVWFSRGRHTTK